MRTARNLWHNPRSAYSDAQFTYSGPCLFTHRGVEVFKNHRGSWDYLLGDTAITQRAGFHKDRAASIIDEILDGEQPVQDGVAAHINAHGHKACGWAQYNALVAAGERE